MLEHLLLLWITVLLELELLNNDLAHLLIELAPVRQLVLLQNLVELRRIYSRLLLRLLRLLLHTQPCL